ncbi:uncharacterized protein LOC143446558 isoform X1 [Clavelina lepadiformis]|uniref:uncharacterized protein LOC143446558 isoform X1 n=1 Tax=Clavelina lepadiformis TaxID=159417 RepID=UPI00404233C1
MGLGLEILCLFIFFVLPRNSYFCDAQASFTSITESNTPQAIGSDVVITAVVATSSIPASVTWRINGETVGASGVNSGSNTVASEDSSSSYASRIDVSVGSYASSQFTTTLNITGLTATDHDANVVITTVGSSDASILLVVQECSLNTTAYPSLTFTCDDSSCEFNSAGTLSCADGYTASGVSTTSTTCLTNATVSNLDVLSCAAITCQGSDAEDNDTDVCLVNQTLVSTTFSYNDTISVQCCEGFEGSGPVDRTCDESSGWTSVNLGCTAITTTTITSTAATTLQVTTTTALTTTYNSTTTTSPTSPVTTTLATTSTASATTAAVTTNFGATSISSTATSPTVVDFQADNSLNDSMIYSGSNTTDSNAGEAHILFLPWSLLCCFHIFHFLILQIHH